MYRTKDMHFGRVNHPGLDTNNHYISVYFSLCGCTMYVCVCVCLWMHGIRIKHLASSNGTLAKFFFILKMRSVYKEKRCDVLLSMRLPERISFSYTPNFTSDSGHIAIFSVHTINDLMSLYGNQSLGERFFVCGHFRWLIRSAFIFEQDLMSELCNWYVAFTNILPTCKNEWVI